MDETELYKLFAKTSIANQAIAKHYGTAIGSLILLFTIVHWMHKLAHKAGSLQRTFAALSRPLKRAATGLAFGGVLVLPGRLLLAIVYFAINIILTFINVNWDLQTLFAKRLGW